MAKFSIRFKESVIKDLRNIPNHDIQRILARIDQLADEPRGESCIKLAGYDAYRARQGLYRIIYTIADEQLIVEVIKIAHRSKAYKNY